jgi:hypothetical protein
VSGVEDGALAMARARALGAVPAVQGRGPLGTAAAMAGRVLVELEPLDSRGPRLALGWAAGCEPPEDQALMPRRPVPAMLAITFAVALRCCWPDPLGPPYPGVKVTRQQVLHDVLLVQGHSPDAVAARSHREAGNVGGRWNARRALDQLVLSGYLEDRPPDGVRPGRLVALWSPAQVARARALWSFLPASGPGHE